MGTGPTSPAEGRERISWEESRVQDWLATKAKQLPQDLTPTHQLGVYTLTLTSTLVLTQRQTALMV